MSGRIKTLRDRDQSADHAWDELEGCTCFVTRNETAAISATPSGYTVFAVVSNNGPFEDFSNFVEAVKVCNSK